ncbi:MAG: flavodoxin family protein [Firmicutes bacterium]|nr:flavodoxin family protein [Bacillota bacterium]
MKVLMINGSPKANGCIATAFKIAKEIFDAEGIETEVVHIGNKDIRGCIACLSCRKTGKCVFNDLVNETAPKLREADGVIVGSPVYFGMPNGTALSFMQRLFYSAGVDTRMKVGASVVSCRRGGNSGTYQTMNMIFGMTGMPLAPSSYWNDVHGYTPDDVYADIEGVQTMKNLAHNMVFMMKAIADGKETYGMPEREAGSRRNFIYENQ